MVLKHYQELIETMDTTLSSSIDEITEKFPNADDSQFKKVHEGVLSMKKQFREKIEMHPYLLNKADPEFADYL